MAEKKKEGKASEPLDPLEFQKRIIAETQAKILESFQSVDVKKAQEEFLKQSTESLKKVQAQKQDVPYVFESGVLSNKKTLQYGNFKLLVDYLAPNNNQSFIDLFKIELFDGSNSHSYDFIVSHDTTQKSLFQLYVLTPEKDYLLVKDFSAQPSDEVAAASAIDYFKNFKEKVINNFDFEKYLELRRKAVEFTRKAFPDSKVFTIFTIKDELLMYRFQPMYTKYNFKQSVIYDFRDEKFFTINTIESLESFVNSNKKQINNGEEIGTVSSANLELLRCLVLLPATNQFKMQVNSSEDVLKYRFVDSENQNEVANRIEPFKKDLKPPTVNGKEFTMYTLDTWYPCVLEKWTVTELKSGDVKVKSEALLNDVYVPSFLTLNFHSENKLSYIS